MSTFSLLIIEDEKLERDMLRELLFDLIPECEAVYEADNGITALRICQEYQPAILLVDINIPGISGLNLIETLQQANYPGKTVIITAYDRFGYIKKALSLGVCEFLLKPVDEDELKHAVYKCAAELEAERKTVRDIDFVCSYAESYLVRDIIDGNTPENALCTAFSWPHDKKLQARLIRIVPGRDMQENMLARLLQICREHISREHLMLSGILEGEVIIIFTPKKSADWCYLQLSCRIGIEAVLKAFQYEGIELRRLIAGEICSSYGQLREEYLESRKADPELASPKLVLNMPVLPLDSLGTGRERRKLRQKWVQHLREGKSEYLSKMLYRAIGKQDTFWPSVQLFLEALNLLDEAIDLEKVLSLFCEERPFEKLESWLDVYFKTRENSHEGSQHHLDAVVKRAQMLLQERYAEQLSEQEIAEEFGMSQAYFSRLFKARSGCNFTVYLTNIRMEKAKELLADERFMIRDVAEQCGYLNYRSFLALFQKKTGYTPSEYRSTLQKESDNIVRRSTGL